MRHESRKGPKRKKKKTYFISWEDFFSYCFFITPFHLHFKNDFWSLRYHSRKNFNHSKWSSYDADINKCSVIGRQSVMGWSTLPYKDEAQHPWSNYCMFIILTITWSKMAKSSQKHGLLIWHLTLQERRGGGPRGQVHTATSMILPTTSLTQSSPYNTEMLFNLSAHL